MPLTLLGATSGSLTVSPPDVAGSNTQTLVATTGTLAPIVTGTSKAWNWNGSTTNKEIDFTDIPSWVKRITLMFSGISTSGTSNILIQLGDSGGIETTGYLGAGAFAGASTGGANYTTGFGIGSANAGNIGHGSVTISKFASGNEWIASGNIGLSSSAFVFLVGGSKSLSDTLTQVRVTTVSGADNFDAGTVNIIYE